MGEAQLHAEVGALHRRPIADIFVATDQRAVSDADFVVVGGAAMDGPRHIWWNFVSSRQERIEAAKADWKAGRFDVVPGDTVEFIPLPS